MEHRDVPIALGRVAKETVEELVQSLVPGKLDRVESDQEIEEKIAGIDLSQSCLNAEEKGQFRKMLKQNRNSPTFTMAE